MADRERPRGSSPAGVASPPGEHILGRREGGRPGPTLLVLGGLHGNEPAGVAAIRRVLADLSDLAPPMRGRLVGLVGNRAALEREVRYVTKDLNRQWVPDRIEALRRLGASGGGTDEDREQLGILAGVEAALAGVAVGGDAYFLDLHTCSAEGSPFLTLGDTLRNRRFALGIPLPVVLGLEEEIDGSLLEYVNNRGVVTLGVEGGQHGDPASVDHLESAVWFALVSAGLLRAEEVPRLAAHGERLRRASSGLPRVIEVRSRQVISDSEPFHMEPGFSNVQAVARGRLLATIGGKEVRALQDGLVLLPRYQGQGDDGFFLAREVRPLWLRISAVMRRLGLARLVARLPGVRRHPEEEGTLVVDTRVARVFSLEVFHLLGYRKVRREGPHLHVTRRRFDTVLP